jgi:hypothetical protein
MKEKMMIKMNVRRYGGAESPFAWIRENEPISAMMVGTKSGREAKETLQPKYITPVR